MLDWESEVGRPLELVEAAWDGHDGGGDEVVAVAWDGRGGGGGEVVAVSWVGHTDCVVGLGAAEGYMGPLKGVEGVV